MFLPPDINYGRFILVPYNKNFKLGRNTMSRHVQAMSKTMSNPVKLQFSLIFYRSSISFPEFIYLSCFNNYLNVMLLYLQSLLSA